MHRVGKYFGQLFLRHRTYKEWEDLYPTLRDPMQKADIKDEHKLLR